jgi:hypothetical protein
MPINYYQIIPPTSSVDAEISFPLTHGCVKFGQSRHVFLCLLKVLIQIRAAQPSQCKLLSPQLLKEIVFNHVAERERPCSSVKLLMQKTQRGDDIKVKAARERT